MLWDLAEQAGVTCFGTSAAYIASCMKGGVEPGDGRDLSRLHQRGVHRLTAGARGLRLGVRARGQRHVAVLDLRGNRRVHGVRRRRAHAAGVPGRVAGPSPGRAVEAFDEDGRALTGEVGELVITEPMPSMPLFFWNDPDGERLRDSYFSMYPGIWRHGDWIELTDRGTAVIYGRSDSTINRGGDPHGHERDLPRGAGPGRGGGRPGGRRAVARRRELDAAVRGPARRGAARRRR